MNRKYLLVIFGLMFLSNIELMSSESAMIKHYQNANNIVWALSGLPVDGSMISSKSFDNFRSHPLMSPVQESFTKKLLPAPVSSSYIQPSVENKYIRRNDLSFADDVFLKILQTDPSNAIAPRFSMSDFLNSDCKSPPPSILGGGKR